MGELTDLTKFWECFIYSGISKTGKKDKRRNNETDNPFINNYIFFIIQVAMKKENIHKKIN